MASSVETEEIFHAGNSPIHKPHVMGEPFKRLLAHEWIFGYRDNHMGAGLLIHSLPQARSGKIMKSVAAGLLYIANYVGREAQIQNGEFPVPDPLTYASEVAEMDLIEVRNALDFYDSSVIIPNDSAWEDAFDNPAFPAVYVWEKDLDGKVTKVRNTGDTTVFQAIKAIDPSFDPKRFKLYNFQRIIAASLFDENDSQVESPTEYTTLTSPETETQLLSEYEITTATRHSWNDSNAPLRQKLKVIRKMLRNHEATL